MKTFYVEDDRGNPTDQVLAYVTKASDEDASYVLGKLVHEDGRSNFKWIRLQDGTLILGVFPRGDTYEEMAVKNEV